MTPARALLLVTSGIACLATAAGALVGLIVAGPLAALILGTGVGAGSTVGAFLVRRRAMAAHARDRAAVMAHGYAEGIAQYVLLIVCNYEAAVFPRSGPHGVTPDERAARRTDAYRIAAEEEVPHRVREARPMSWPPWTTATTAAPSPLRPRSSSPCTNTPNSLFRCPLDDDRRPLIFLASLHSLPTAVTGGPARTSTPHLSPRASATAISVRG